MVEVAAAVAILLQLSAGGALWPPVLAALRLSPPPARCHLRERGVKRKASSLHGQLHCSSQNGDGYQKTVNACGFGVPILAAKSTPAAAGTER